MFNTAHSMKSYPSLWDFFLTYCLLTRTQSLPAGRENNLELKCAQVKFSRAFCFCKRKLLRFGHTFTTWTRKMWPYDHRSFHFELLPARGIATLLNSVHVIAASMDTDERTSNTETKGDHSEALRIDIREQTWYLWLIKPSALSAHIISIVSGAVDQSVLNPAASVWSPRKNPVCHGKPKRAKNW